MCCYGIFDVFILTLFTLGTIIIALYVLSEKQSQWLDAATIGLIAILLMIIVYMLFAVLGFHPLPADPATNGSTENLGA